jgi:hypothetical protein
MWLVVVVFRHLDQADMNAPLQGMFGYDNLNLNIVYEFIYVITLNHFNS